MADEKETKRPRSSCGLWFFLLIIAAVFTLVYIIQSPIEKQKKPATLIKPPRQPDSASVSPSTFKELLRATVDTLAVSKLEDFNLPDRRDTLLAGVKINPAAEITAEGWRLWVVMKCRQGFDLYFTITLNTTETVKEFRKKIAKNISQLMTKAAPILRQSAAFKSPTAIVQFAQSAHDLHPYAVNPAAFQKWIRNFIHARLDEVTSETSVVGFALRPQELMEFHRHLNAIYRGLGDIVVHQCLVAFCRVPASSPRFQKERKQLAKAANFLGSDHEQRPRDYQALFQFWGKFIAAKLRTTKSFEATDASFRPVELPEKPKLLAVQSPVTLAPGFSIDAIYKMRKTLNWQQAANAYFNASPFWAAMTEKLGVTVRGNPRLGGRAKFFFLENKEAIALSQFLRSQGDNWVAAVTGTYTTPETTVVGLAYLDGALIGGLVQEWSGFCLLAKTGRLCIVDWHDLDLARIATALQIKPANDTSFAAPQTLKIFFKPEDYAAFISFIEKNQLSVIQGHLLVHRRQIAVRQGGPLFSRRLLVQFENNDFGLIDLQGTDLDKRQRTFTLSEAAAIAQALNASEAMNLDMGTWNWGVLKMGSQQVELGAPLKIVANRLTNALILYTETEQVKQP